MFETGKQMSAADKRGLRPYTSSNGDKEALDSEGVILIEKEISVSRSHYSGTDGRSLRIFNSYVRVLC